MKEVTSAPAAQQVDSATQPSSRMTSLADQQWRQAVLAVRDAERAYRELLADRDAPEKLVGRAWLELWRAERQRDHILASARDSGED
jgi:hypothetical protein